MRRRLVAWLLAWGLLGGVGASAWGGSATLQDGKTLSGEVMLSGGRAMLRADGREQILPLEEIRELRFVDPERAPTGLLKMSYADAALTELMDYQVSAALDMQVDHERPPRGARWVGWIVVPTSGRYQFNVETTSLVAIWIDQKRVLNYKGTGEYGVEIPLQAQRRYPLMVEFSSARGSGRFQVTVRPPHGERMLIPEQWLQAGPMPAADQGMLAEYFKDRELKQRVETAIVARPYLDRTLVPRAVGHDNYSIRYTARLTPARSDEYTFDVDVADGARIWVDETLVLDAWDKDMGERSGKPIRLAAGKVYRLRIEYMQFWGPLRLMVGWSGRRMPREPLPAEVLRVPEEAESQVKPLAPVSGVDYSRPRLAEGVVLVNGTVLAGKVAALDESVLRFRPEQGAERTFPREQVGRIIWQVLPYDQSFAPEARGLLLRDGDFYEGEVRAVRGEEVMVDSLLFGRRTFSTRQRAVAAVLGDVKAPGLTWSVAARDGAVYQSRELKIQGEALVVDDPVAGRLTLQAEALYLVRRHGSNGSESK